MMSALSRGVPTARYALGLLLTVLAVASTTPTAVAFAGDAEEAAAYFDQATADFVRGNYRPAALAFEEAFRLEPHPAALYSAGVAWQLAGDRGRAADNLAHAMVMQQLDEEPLRDAGERLRVLKAELATLSVAAPTGSLVSVGHASRRPTPAVVHLEPGKEYEVRVALPDGTSRAKRVLATKGVMSVAFGVLKPEPVVTEPGLPARRAPREQAQRVQHDQGGSAQRMVGWTALAGAVVSVGAAGYCWAEANGAKGSFEDSGYTDGDARERAKDYVKWTNVSLGAASVMAVTGAILLLTSPSALSNANRNREPDSVNVAVAPQGISVSTQF